ATTESAKINRRKRRLFQHNRPFSDMTSTMGDVRSRGQNGTGADRLRLRLLTQIGITLARGTQFARKEVSRLQRLLTHSLPPEEESFALVPIRTAVVGGSSRISLSSQPSNFCNIFVLPSASTGHCARLSQ